MRAARWSFGLAGIYGLAVTLPLYLRPQAADTLWFYGFAGAAAATQLLYLLIASDPVRFRPAIPVGIVSKLSFGVPALLFYAQGQVGADILAAGLVDLALAALFLFWFVRLGRFAD